MHTANIELSESIYQTTHMMINHFDNFGFIDNGSRLLVVFVSSASLLIIAYLVKILIESSINFEQNLKKNKENKMLSRLSNHYIVCGVGRVGLVVLEQFKKEGVRAVGIDKTEERVRDLQKTGVDIITGDPTNEQFLEKVQIAKAQGIVACSSHDSDNMMIALIAKQLNPNIEIVARLNEPNNRPRFEKIGVNRLVLPQEIGGYHLAISMLRPEVTDYLDVSSSKDFDNTTKVA
jgi:voltage-gated potassium channel